MNTLSKSATGALTDISPTIVVLAAGKGSRLGALTKHTPKCLTAVAGVPILRRLLDEVADVFGRHCNMLIVVGHLREKIETYLADCPPIFPFKLIENRMFARTGTLESLRLALASASPANDVFLIEGDVVFESPLFRRLVTEKKEASITTVVAPWAPELSGTFVILDKSNSLTDWVHESQRAPSFPLTASYKTVNLTRLSVRGTRRLHASIDTTKQNFGPNAPLEYAFRTMLCAGERIDAVITQGERWYEIDTVEDLAVAEQLFNTGGRTHCAEFSE